MCGFLSGVHDSVRLGVHGRGCGLVGARARLLIGWWPGAAGNGGTAGALLCLRHRVAWRWGLHRMTGAGRSCTCRSGSVTWMRGMGWHPVHPLLHWV